jgi:CheY-like chemotaxis protein
VSSRELDILVVDDNLDFAEMLADVVQLRGYRCQVAGSGEECVRYVARHAVDVVFMDVMLPGMDGVAAARAVQALRPEAAILLVTGYTDENLRRRAEQDGFPVIYKPVTVDRVLMAVDQIPLRKPT